MPYLTGDDLTDTRTVLMTVPNDQRFNAAFLGALATLTKPENWEQAGSVSVETAATAFLVIYNSMIDT